MRGPALALVALGALTLTSCAKEVEAPYSQGVCYSVSQPEGEDVRFNVLAVDQPQIEYCAARLEEMRLRFLRLGGNKREVTGAYQGQFIFVDQRGVSFNKRLDGVRFMALARTGDGRLAIPGAIQRSVDGSPIAVAAPPPPSPAPPAG